MGDPVLRQRADRQQLQQIITGLTEGVILVDPDGSFAWANEAALAMHGVEKLEELGATVDEYRMRFELRYRNHHRLSAGDTPIDRVLAGEQFRDVIVAVARAGDAEPQWVHRIRSLVLTDAVGNPDCLVLVLHDATERFDAEERFERTFNANPAAAIICRLSDLRFIKVNQGFQEMTGYMREQLIGRSVYEIDVLENAERKNLAIERLNEGRTIPQMEAVLRLPDNGTKLVIVAGQPIEIGDEGCMLFTFMDMEPRKKAEDALRQSEERFSKSFRLTPVSTMISTLQGFQILDVNDAFVAATGYAAEEVIGRTAAEIRLWRSAVSRKQLEQELEKTGSIRDVELQMHTKDGDVTDWLVSAETVTIQGQPCVLSVMQDITERKRSEVELIAAIEAVMQDTSWFSRTVIEKLANLRQPHGSNRPRAALKDLTARERDVLSLACQGLTDGEIAERLGISRNTIRNQVASLYEKTDVHRRSALVVWGRERGVTGEGPLPTRKEGSRKS
ncbi:MAG: helix-turn-helix transcriptional regulator [Chloroflexota bacterium]|nr:helix-turn-helix transcriptional regulator [Chloroflexota bacterium]